MTTKEKVKEMKMIPLPLDCIMYILDFIVENNEDTWIYFIDKSGKFKVKVNPSIVTPVNLALSYYIVNRVTPVNMTIDFDNKKRNVQILIISIPFYYSYIEYITFEDNEESETKEYAMLYYNYGYYDDNPYVISEKSTYFINKFNKETRNIYYSKYQIMDNNEITLTPDEYWKELWGEPMKKLLIFE